MLALLIRLAEAYRWAGLQAYIGHPAARDLDQVEHSGAAASELGMHILKEKSLVCSNILISFSSLQLVGLGPFR